MVHLDLKRADGLKHVIQFAARRIGQVEIQPMRADVQPTLGKLTLENAQPCPRPPKGAMIVGAEVKNRRVQVVRHLNGKTALLDNSL